MKILPSKIKDSSLIADSYECVEGNDSYLLLSGGFCGEDEFYYKDVRQLLFRTPLYKVEIHGVTEATFYKYNKDGTLNTVPKKNITCDAYSSFYTMFNPEIDFAKVFETHTPLKIEYHDASYSLDYDRRELNNFFEMIDIECAQVVVVYCIAIGQVPVTISHAEDYGC